MSKQDDVKELIEKITQIDNEIKLLQEDRKTVLEDYKGKLDLCYTVQCPETHPTNPEPKASELAAACWMNR